MHIFNIIGPIMIGPSSSHTAGACRLGRVANKVLNGRTPVSVDFELYGSFARTFRGHGTDVALLGGLMGMHSDDERIRDAFALADAAGLLYRFIPMTEPASHPNTVRIRFTLADGTMGEMMGASIGGGNIRVDEVNGMRVDFNGELTTMLILHDDVPGVIAAVTNVMRERYQDLNISNFHLSRTERGGEAIMTIEVDTVPPEEIQKDIEALDHVENVFVIRAI